MFSDVLDTFVFKNNEIYLKEFHVARSFEAYQLVDSSVLLEDFFKIYSELEKKLQTQILENQMVRLIFSARQKLSYHYEMIEKNPLPNPVVLELTFSSQNLAGLGTQNYKWTEREVWQQLLKNKSPEADDVLVVNASHQITETSRFNLFLYNTSSDQVYTPPLDTGCISGVFRRYALSEKRIDLPGYGFKKLFEKNISVADLQSSSSIYLIYVANSVRGVLNACLTKNQAKTN